MTHKNGHQTTAAGMTRAAGILRRCHADHVRVDEFVVMRASTYDSLRLQIKAEREFYHDAVRSHLKTIENILSIKEPPA